MRPGTSCRPEMRPEWPWIWVAIWVAPDAKGTQQEAASPLTFHTPSSPLADWISELIPATDYWYTPIASQTPLSTTQQLADLLSFQCQIHRGKLSTRMNYSLPRDRDFSPLTKLIWSVQTLHLWRTATKANFKQLPGRTKSGRYLWRFL